MLIHYVEDNQVDARLMTSMLRADDSVDVSISPSLTELDKRALAQDDNHVLIDVYRPDAVSVEDDVARVREVSDGPIAFITGGDVEELRLRALKAGAEAVLDKSTVSSNLLKHVFSNADARRRALASDGDIAATSAAGFDPTRIMPSLDYVEGGLSVLTELIGRGAPVSMTTAMHLQEAVRAIYRCVARGGADADAGDPSLRLLRHMDAYVEGLAQAKDVELAIEGRASRLSELLTDPLATLGLQHLVEGALRICAPGGRLSVSTRGDATRRTLKLQTTNGPLPAPESFAGGEWLGRADANVEAAGGAPGYAALQFAAALLTITPECVRTVTEGDGGSLTVSLSF